MESDAAAYNEDLLKLQAADATQTPRVYLVRAFDTEGTYQWYSLPAIAAALPTYAEFVTYVGTTSFQVGTDTRILQYLWLVSRLTSAASATQTSDLLQQVGLDQGQYGAYTDWRDNFYNLSLAADLRRLAILNADQALFNAAPPMYYTAPQVERVTVATKITGVGNLSALDVLNAVDVDDSLYLVVDVDANKTITVKAYDGDQPHDIPALNQLDQLSTLYFFITKAPYILTLTYSPTYELTFSTTDRDKDIANARQALETHSPLRFGAIYTKRVTASFKVFGDGRNGLAFFPVLALTALLGNGRINRYMYADETRELFLDRTRLALQLRRPFRAEPFPAAATPLTITPQLALDQPYVVYVPYQPTAYELRVPNMAHWHLTLQVPNEAFLTGLTGWLVTFLSYWLLQQVEAQPFATVWLGEAATSTRDARTSGGTVTSRGSTAATTASSTAGGDATAPPRRKIYILKALAPDLFVTDYPRACAAEVQPDFIQPDQVVAWEAGTFVFKGMTYQRQSIPMPDRDNPKYYFVCKNEQYPFPGAKISTLANAQQYPLVPCCYDSNQYVVGNNYWNLLNGVRTERASGASTHVVRVEMLLERARMGVVPPNVGKALAQAMPDTTPDQFLRYGTVRGVNSILHAICLALEDPAYTAIYDSDLPESQRLTDLEAYVTSLRPGLAANPLWFRQECYDQTLEQIAADIANPAKYLDPLRYYTGLQYAFGCRLFLFSWPATGQEGFWLPRTRYFEAYNRPPAAPAVLILLHRGATADAANLYPQSELIVRKFGTQTTVSFAPPLAESLQGIVDACQVVNYTKIGQTKIANVHGVIFDPTRVFTADLGWELVNQRVDAIGKGYGVSLRRAAPAEADQPTGLLFVTTPPFAPLPLPVIPITQPLVVPDATYQTYRKYLPPATAMSVAGGGVTCYWFTAAGIPQGACIRVSGGVAPPPGPLTLPLAPEPHVPTPADLALERQLIALRRTERQVVLFVQIILYVYLVYTLERPEADQRSVTDPAVLPEFWSQYTTVTPGAYNWNPLKRVFPEGSLAETLTGLAQEMPTLITSAKIRFADTALDQRMRSTIAQWLHAHRAEEISIPTVLDGFYQHEDDFTMRPRQRIFTDWPSYQLWTNREHDAFHAIANQITSADADTENPFVFIQNDRLYIVQNVAGSEFSRAMRVASYWRQEKINTGYNTQVYPPTVPYPATRVWRLTENNDIDLETDYAEGSDNAIDLVKYEANKYAALLPLFDTVAVGE